MKKIILMLSVVMFACSVSGCDKDDGGGVTPPVTYPIEIPFADYSLEGTSCKWKNLKYDNNLIVINSNEELENYIEYSGGTYPEIDFSKKTLLLIRGGTGNGIHHIEVRFLQHTSDEYALNVDVYLDMTQVVQEWGRTMVVPKINDVSKIKLTVTSSYYMRD